MRSSIYVKANCMMKWSIVVFIKALRYCKFNKERISNDILASSFRGKKIDLFWKEVRKRQPSNRIKNNEIDGLTDNDDVARLFHDKFKAVAGSVNDDVPECEGFRGNASFRKKFSNRHIICALSQLKKGIGFDGIHANHLKFTSPIISHTIPRLIDSCFIHNHFPQDMLSGVIKPSIKDKSGNIKSSNNYWEVMISTNFFQNCRVHDDATIHLKNLILVLISLLTEVIALPFLSMIFYEKF